MRIRRILPVVSGERVETLTTSTVYPRKCCEIVSAASRSGWDDGSAVTNAADERKPPAGWWACAGPRDARLGLMLRIGLTGGMGAGKSTVARILAERGAVIVDSDVIAREVVAPGTEGLAALAEAFGPGILTEDGSLDRPALAAVAFADEESRKKFNAISHPLGGKRTAELIAAAPADAVVVQDIPLLVENGLAPL